MTHGLNPNLFRFCIVARAPGVLVIELPLFRDTFGSHVVRYGVSQNPEPERAQDDRTRVLIGPADGAFASELLISY
jgi:hypothetical protein